MKGQNGNMLYEYENFENLQYENDCIEDLIFADCVFKNCRFMEMEIRHCSFKSCTFRGCTILNNNFKFTDATDNRFEGCSVIGMAWNEVEQESNIMLPFSAFSDCTLKHNLFVGFKMKKFQFQDCDLIGSSFQQCDLRESSFRRAGLTDVSFQQNNLMGADFRDARDYAISLENNKLKKAKFTFPDAVRLLSATGIIVE
ncbi:pentapeptide repeat-containing protein [Anaerovorax odorimutans]|uniref:Pentapeptide repeat-containing protein n=2 Tax=Anaerovorax odorimutans TaxID=109327 RepID=A0ABT1RN31_9FIRM|nr:pentapeptide repeat-containing protein [Anaerovorax odorimutans]